MQDKLVEAHARLSALKMQLPDTSMVEDRYVREFHEIVQILEQASGCDLGEYRVPSAEVALHPAGGNTSNGGSNGHDGGNGHSGSGGSVNGHDGAAMCALEPACERHRLLLGIDGVLAFFGIQATPPRN